MSKIENLEKGIIEVLNEFPDSLSFCFQLSKDGPVIGKNYTYYMKLGDPIFTPEDSLYVSVVQVMGFNRSKRSLWFDKLFLPRGKELIACTNKNLLDMLLQTVSMVNNDLIAIDVETFESLQSLGLIDEIK